MAEIISFRSRQSDPKSFPAVFRIRSLASDRGGEGGAIQHKAIIFHSAHEYRVSWKSKSPEDLNPGDLVRIEWGEWPICDDGSLALARLIRVDR
jgi:hypothetical protein